MAGLQRPPDSNALTALAPYASLHHNAQGTLAQFVIGGLYIHHQVTIHLTQLNHHAGGQHVEHHFLRSAAL